MSEFDPALIFYTAQLLKISAGFNSHNWRSES